MALFDGKLKQRLIGALVLLVLAVVFLPMIFNNKGEKIPETVVTVPTAPTKPASPANQAATTVIEATPTTTSQPPTIPNEVANTPTPPPATQTAEQPIVAKPNTSGLTPTWTIQVAAVTNLKNAEAFMEKLRKANYNAYIRSEGNVHRVFVGPFIEKTVTTKIQQQIQKQSNEKGIIREFKPENQ